MGHVVDARGKLPVGEIPRVDTAPAAPRKLKEATSTPTVLPAAADDESWIVTTRSSRPPAAMVKRGEPETVRSPEPNAPLPSSTSPAFTVPLLSLSHQTWAVTWAALTLPLR